MTYIHTKKLDLTKDFILPCRKDQLDTIKEFLPLAKPDFDGSFSTYLLLYGKDGNRIYLVGLGEEKHSAQLENTFIKYRQSPGRLLRLVPGAMGKIGYISGQGMANPLGNR